MDMNEGILVQDVEAEVDTMEEDAVVERKEDSKIMDEENKKLLRDKLRKTLSHKASRPGMWLNGAQGRVLIIHQRDYCRTHLQRILNKMQANCFWMLVCLSSFF